MKDLFEKLLVLRSPGVGPVKYNAMITKFGGAAEAAEFLNLTNEFKDLVAHEMDTAAKLGISFISEDDDLYPAALRDVKNHPIIISVRGNTDTLKKQTIGIVGTRHATAAGIKFVSDISATFAENNFAVVSGMAMGTDTAAHTGALCAAGDTQTIAVLAGGVDYVWPLENESLYYRICERGCVISDMPVGFIPTPGNFAQRNRHIAGLSQRLILSEADAGSGSMHTARFANDMEKEVFAIPSHPSDARAHGPNSLIKSGLAKICTGADDFFTPKTQKMKNKKTPENPILSALGINPLAESVLSEIVQKNVAEIKRELVILELQGYVRKVSGGYIKA